MNASKSHRGRYRCDVLNQPRRHEVTLDVRYAPRLIESEDEGKIAETKQKRKHI